ncbi:MAG: hypothetical protein AAB822_01570 [Patescibacteria group bacterium]
MNYTIADLLSVPYATRVLVGAFGFALVFFAIISVILFYHWRRYEPSNGKIFFFALIYLGGSAMFFMGAIYFLFSFIK